MLVEAGLESFSPRAVDLQSIPLYFRHGLTSRAVGTPINPPNRSLTEAGGPQRGAASPSKGEGRALPTATCPARRGLPPRTTTASPEQARPSAQRGPAGTTRSRRGGTARSESTHTLRRCPAATSCPLADRPALRREKGSAGRLVEGHATASTPGQAVPPAAEAPAPPHCGGSLPRPYGLARRWTAAPRRAQPGSFNLSRKPSCRSGTGMADHCSRTEKPQRAASGSARP